MTYQARAEEIAAVVRAVEGSGLVHPRVRITNDWKKYMDNFRTDAVGLNGRAIKVLNGWEISRRNFAPLTPPDLDETYEFRKYYGISDANESEFAFQANLSAVSAVFRDLHNFSFGAIPAGLVVREIDERVFGEVLCHYAECELRVVSDWYALE